MVGDHLECSICTNVFNDPVQACTNGHTFCRGCLQVAMESKNQCPTCSVELTSISSNRVVKTLIENARVYCFTRLQSLEAANNSTSSPSNGSTDADADDDDIDGDAAAAAASSGSKRKSSRSSSSSSSSSSSGTAVAKRAKSDLCMWTGKLDDAKQHFTECVYAGVLCAFGCGAIVLRKDMHEHEASLCPERREVQCTNAGCNALMSEAMLARHKTNDCPFEEVDCPFKTVGCNERMLRKDVKHHTDTMTNQHVILLLQDNQAIKQKVAEQEQENQLLLQGNHLLQQQVAEQEERLNRQQNEIVFNVNVADLIQRGEVQMNSDFMRVGAYNVWLCVKKGFAAEERGYLGNWALFGGDCCGVHLHLADGSFPCRVTCILEVVHWDGDGLSIFKHEFTNTYLEEKGYGPPQMIALSKLTAAASPYVKDGHVTFIANFQILPLG